MKIRWPFVKRERYDALTTRYHDLAESHQVLREAARAMAFRHFSSDPKWLDSETHMRKLSEWLYNYEGIRSDNAQETFDRFTKRYLEIRKLAAQDQNYRARLGLPPLEPWQ